MRRSGRGGILAGMGVGVCAAAMALAGEPPPSTPAYGTAGLSTATVSALEFSTYIQGENWSTIPGSTGRYLLSSFGEFVGAVHLPQGALIQSVEIEGCDSSSSGSLTGSFYAAPAPPASLVDLADFDTGASATPGCGVFSAAVSPPVTVDNQHNVYFFGLGNTPGDGSTFYTAARVYYQLQISPAPATPDFSDVPTAHPFFREIEALYKAGITSGCGGGNFCPDSPLTRAQAAALFARALGLYWPN